MENPLVLSFLFLLIGLILGFVVGLWWQRLKQNTDYVSREELSQLYISKELHEHLQEQADLQREDLLEKDQEILKLSAYLAGREERLIQQEEKLMLQTEEVEKLQTQARIEFENLANRLLDEKSKQFKSQNQEQLQEILNPLKEKIKHFEDGIEKRFVEETRDRVSLKKEIEHLRELNQQLSEDANNLASALKGGNKTQGDWGELQLEMLLERAGLTRDIHYQTQSSFKDEDGRQKRPDFIINLPDQKHLIIDSKVSLTAYEKFFSATESTKQKKIPQTTY